VRGVLRPPITVYQAPSEIVIERDLPVITRDGTTLRGQRIRPQGEARRPVILSIHPYGKDNLPTRRRGQWTYSFQYRHHAATRAVAVLVADGWEAPDPVWWVARGFAVVNADLRGCGRSEGTAQLLSPQEGRDVYDVVQWAGEQPLERWPGRDGSGCPILAISQYGAAALRPSALSAIVPWEGFSDPYRDFAMPGGIREKGFMRVWGTVLRRTIRQAYEPCWRCNEHILFRDGFWASLTPDLSKIDVPMLVCGSFTDQSLHTRGSMRVFTTAGSAARASLHPPHRQVVDVLLRRSARRTTHFRPRCARRLGARPRSVRLEVREDGRTSPPSARNPSGP